MPSDEENHDYEVDVDWDDGTTTNRSRVASRSARSRRAYAKSAASATSTSKGKGKEPANQPSEQPGSSRAASTGPSSAARTRSAAAQASNAPEIRLGPNGRPLKLPQLPDGMRGPISNRQLMGGRTFGQLIRDPRRDRLDWSNVVDKKTLQTPVEERPVGDALYPPGSASVEASAANPFGNRDWGDMRPPGHMFGGPEAVEIPSQGAFFAPHISAIFTTEDDEKAKAAADEDNELEDDEPAAEAAFNFDTAQAGLAAAMGIPDLNDVDDLDINMAVPLLGPTGFLPMNDADRAERAGYGPDDSFALPVNRHVEFDSRFFGPRNNNVLHIAKKTNTHLSLPEGNDDPFIYIWGQRQDIIKAKADLLKLMKMTDAEIDLAQRRVGGWAKIRAAPSDRKQLHLEKVYRENKERVKFRKAPEVGQIFPCAGVFYWPREDIDPQEKLGLAFEFLDDIRTEQKVYIIYDRKSGFFRVLGGTNESVDKAVARIYGVFCEIASKNRRGIKMILVMPPDEMSVRKTVCIDQKHPFIDRQVTVKRVKSNSGIQLYLPEADEFPDRHFLKTWPNKKGLIERANMNFMRKAVQQGLSDVAYYRGYAKMKIYFGQLVLFGYKRSTTGTYELPELMEMLRAQQTQGEIIRTLANPDLGCSDGTVADELLRAIREDSAFHPVDINPDGHRASIQNEEYISATFELRLYDERGRSTEIRLEVEFSRMPNCKEYKPSSHRWINIADGDRRESRRKGPLDLKVFDIKTTIAYQLELTTWTAVMDTDIYPIFAEFVRRLKVEDLPDPTAGHRPAPGQPDTRPTIRRVSFTNLPGVSVATLVQKTKYRFWMADTKYIFELCKYESLPVETVSMMFPDGIAITYRDIVEADDVRYGAALWHESWELNLREQINIKKGEKGSWDPEIDVFFQASSSHKKINGYPGNWDPADGFGECIGRVENLIEYIVSAQGAASERETKEAEDDANALQSGADIAGNMEQHFTEYSYAPGQHIVLHQIPEHPSGENHQGGNHQNGNHQNGNHPGGNQYNGHTYSDFSE